MIAILSRNMIISITHPPRQLWTWEYYRQNRTIKLDFMRRQWQALERFWKSDQKSTLITGFWTCNEHGMSRGSKPVHIGDLHMGLISCLQCIHLMMDHDSTQLTHHHASGNNVQNSLSSESS